jgi:hypothetical protein
MKYKWIHSTDGAKEMINIVNKIQMKTICLFFVSLYFSISILGQSEYVHNNPLKKSAVKKYIGLKINQVISELKIDTLNSSLQQEPPGVARGLRIPLKDSSVLFLFIKRRETWLNDVSHILNDTITGVGIAFKNCRKKYWGTGFIWWGLSNPYCKPPIKPKRWYLKQEGYL